MLTLGIIGTGSITRQMLDAVQHTQDITAAAVTSRSLPRAEAFAAELQIPHAFDSYASMLASDVINTVYIASPNALHVPQALAALKAGKHVICEKPLAVTKGESTQLFNEARGQKRFLFEAITPPFLPNFQKIQQWMPALGTIQQVDLVYTQRSSRYTNYLRGETPNVFNPDLQGGALNDLGVYPIHIALALFGKPKQVAYDPIYGRNGIDLSGKLTLDYDGFPCNIFCAKNCDRGTRGLIRGERGVIRMDGPLNELTRCSFFSGAASELSETPSGVNRLCYELTAFRDAIHHRDQTLFERMANESIDAASILEAAHKHP